MYRKLIIIGASGHGKVIADIARLNGYTEILFLDDNASLTTCSGYPVVGVTSAIVDYPEYDCIIGIGNAFIRKILQCRYYNQIVSLIHPSSVIGDNVVIGKGTVIMAGAVVNPGSYIGEGCIINTCSSVDHDCLVGDYVHVSVGAHIAGTCEIGENTWIGAGAIVSNNINICSDCLIGAGAVVIRDIGVTGTYVGVPCRRIK